MERRFISRPHPSRRPQSAGEPSAVQTLRDFSHATLLRAGGDYCGWAPLPPHADYDFPAARFSFNGRRVDASFDFGLGWNQFSCCCLKELGDPPRRHFRQEKEIRSIYSRTPVINNYTVNKISKRPRLHAAVNG